MIWRAFITALLTLALMLVGTGHKPLDPLAEQQATAYVLAGGSLADICGGATGDTDMLHTGPCQACIISATCALPAPATVTAQENLSFAIRWVALPARLGTIRTIHAAPARAPPFRLIA
ncbi:hypothetical protein ACJ5NV_11660 [Loktanella agnita]|uniref:hypothetical protein n=1 Tax=Loktanella agnita TaxID=287097 RepID=UPI0039887BA8